MIHLVLHSNIEWAQGSAEAMPFMDISFDQVLAITVLCFLPNPEAALKEISRVLKLGGMFILGELNRWSLWSLRRRIKGWIDHESPWRKIKFRTAAEWTCILNLHGFNIERVRGTIFFPPWLPLARIMNRFEDPLGNLSTFGTAFIAFAAYKKHI